MTAHSPAVGPALVADGSALDVDVAVIGAGPAGLAAAATAAESGLRVAVLDAGAQPGGQYWRHPDETAGSHPPAGQPLADGLRAEGHHDGLHDAAAYTALRGRVWSAERTGRLSYLPNAQVWFVEAPAPGGGGQPFTLRITGVSDVGPQPAHRLVRAAALILCPGGYDRQLPVPGWDLPGVMAAGGVQALLKSYGVRSGSRAVVAGTGPFLLPVAAGLAEAGVTVLGICEAGAVTSWLPQLGGAVQVPSKALDAVRYAAQLARHRVPYWTRTAITAIHGTDEVSGVTVAAVDERGRAEPGTSRDLDVDLVALGWGFTPSLELVTAVGAATRVDVDGSLVAVVDVDARTTVAGVYAAGEVTGVGGAALAVLEGELAAITVALDRGHDDRPVRRLRLRRGINRARAFAAAMHRAHPVPEAWPDWLTRDTVVCRCEEVTVGDLRHARDDLGAADARTAKLLTRSGMGPCQGRVCGFATATLAGSAPPTADALRALATRPLCSPVALSELAALDGPRPGAVR